MTEKFVAILMKGQGNLAMEALYRLAAVPAHHEIGKAAPIQKNKALLSLVKILPQSFDQLV